MSTHPLESALGRWRTVYHGASYHLRTVSDDNDLNVPSSSPPHRLQKRRLTVEQPKTQPQADATAQPASGHHPNWVPNATPWYYTKGLEALRPGLSSSYCCIYDGGVRTDMS